MRRRAGLPSAYPHHRFRVKTAIDHFTIGARGAPGLKTHDTVRGVAPVPLAATNCRWLYPAECRHRLDFRDFRDAINAEKGAQWLGETVETPKGWVSTMLPSAGIFRREV